jgi:DNA-binding MarR family transcriptional regulator
MEVAAVSFGAIGRLTEEAFCQRKGSDDLHLEVEQAAQSGTETASATPQSTLASRIHRILKLRASRTAIFSDGLFADPAWDMLLDLYIAHLEGRLEAVSSICVASGVPSTTAIRWIKLLEHQGWVCRSPDPTDGRRCFLALTGKAQAAMERFFAQPEITSEI